MLRKTVEKTVSGGCVPGFGFRVSGFGFRVSGFGFRVPGFGFRVPGFEFRVSRFGFQVWKRKVEGRRRIVFHEKLLIVGYLVYICTLKYHDIIKDNIK
jgi:hypothetical protein